MPLQKVEKIWMDGELVDWDDAKIHVLTHTLHYGCGGMSDFGSVEPDVGACDVHGDTRNPTSSKRGVAYLRPD